MAEAPITETDAVKTEAEDALLTDKTEEIKAEGDKPEVDKGATSVLTDEEKPSVDGAPAEYEAFTMPEGVDVDTFALEQFTPIAKELDLNQEQAQKLVNYYSQAKGEAEVTAQKQWVDTMDTWRSQSKADTEFGGRAFEENIGYAKTFLKEYGTPALQEALNATGAGNHPEFLRVFIKAGKAIAEDKMHSGGVTRAPQSAADILFNNTTYSK